MRLEAKHFIASWQQDILICLARIYITCELSASHYGPSFIWLYMKYHCLNLSSAIVVFVSFYRAAGFKSSTE